MIPAITIIPLADLPDAIPQLAQWYHDEWHVFDQRSVAGIAAQLAANLNRSSLPITFIPHDRDRLLGTFSIDLADLPPMDHLSPWLASFYVLPSARGGGIGTALLCHAHQFAADHRIATLHLWTPGTTRLYVRHGWLETGRMTYCDRPITLMRRFSPAP
jgi:GNAT superfamily N-acetyltransferase